MGICPKKAVTMVNGNPGTILVVPKGTPIATVMAQIIATPSTPESHDLHHERPMWVEPQGHRQSAEMACCRTGLLPHWDEGMTEWWSLDMGALPQLTATMVRPCCDHRCSTSSIAAKEVPSAQWITKSTSPLPALKSTIGGVLRERPQVC